MTAKHPARQSPAARHQATAEQEFAAGLIKPALWPDAPQDIETLSEADKARYIALRVADLAEEEARASTAAENSSVVPYEIMLGRLAFPTLLSPLPCATPARFGQTVFVFTAQRLLILSRADTPETSPLPSPPLPYQAEIEQFWQGTRAFITPHNNTLTVRAIEAAVASGAAISLRFDDMHLRRRTLPLPAIDRLLRANPAQQLDISGPFECGGGVQEATLTIQPGEPFVEIQRILNLLPAGLLAA